MEFNMSNSVNDDGEEILSYVHEKRTQVISHLMAKGVPNDLDTVKVLLTALKDMDGQTLSKKRIKLEEKVNDNQAQAAALIAKILGTTGRTNNTDDFIDADVIIPSLPDSIPSPVLVPGEIDLIQKTLTYEEFINKFISSDD